MTTEEHNPAYRIARCGDSSPHGPHVVDHGPDQPRNCPGTGISFWGKPGHVPWCRCRGTGSIVVRDGRCSAQHTGRVIATLNRPAE